MFVAKLPGSMYATAAMKAGPRNGQIRGIPRARPSRDSRAARATAASPGRAPSTAPLPFTGAVSAGRCRGSSVSSSRSPVRSSDLFTSPPRSLIARASLDSHALRQLSAERMDAAADLHHHGTTERLPALHVQLGAGLDLTVGQVTQHRRVAVGDPHKGAPLADL